MYGDYKCNRLEITQQFVIELINEFSLLISVKIKRNENDEKIIKQQNSRHYRRISK
jgi:hypothetical protein